MDQTGITTTRPSATSDTLPSRMPAQGRRRVSDGLDLIAAIGLVARHQRVEGVAADLEAECPDVLFLHHRELGRTGRGTVECLAVTSAGVQVLAFARPDTGEGAQVRSERRAADHVLTERVALLDSRLDRQVLATTTALGAVAIPVHGLICVGDRAPVPSLRTSYPVLDLGAVVTRLQAPGPFGPETRARAHAALAVGMPPA